MIEFESSVFFDLLLVFVGFLSSNCGEIFKFGWGDGWGEGSEDFLYVRVNSVKGIDFAK